MGLLSYYSFTMYVFLYWYSPDMLLYVTCVLRKNVLKPIKISNQGYISLIGKFFKFNHFWQKVFSGLGQLSYCKIHTPSFKKGCLLLLTHYHYKTESYVALSLSPSLLKSSLCELTFFFWKLVLFNLFIAEFRFQCFYYSYLFFPNISDFSLLWP